ncbi:putative E3 ubiquitin-protein [Heterosigma akashiwo virus 01]|uniref:RING-type E3 ubiquitin transferase n=1 Tax=Heterosigma akashiwo virus 01 TaxID=97195 RepID=A0A1C9C515_HAV01|nr:putative E3 ubiquitin-protein [Heterosigma akashiwo virus 01]AOM63376.1 putative E3 ubiquitin-protein [Heterosigma akashiwo virus 01]
MEHIISLFTGNSNNAYIDDSLLTFNDNFSRYIFHVLNNEVRLLNDHNMIDYSNNSSMVNASHQYNNMDFQVHSGNVITIPEVMVRMSIETLPTMTMTFTNMNASFESMHVDNMMDYNTTVHSTLNACDLDNIEKCIISEPLECYICLDKLLRGSCVRKLRCKHMFCINCIDKWLSKYNNTCPVCKESV